ncbi:hypothetical protein MK786_11470 [Microbacterium sp. CFH 31415]|uniref:DUF6541 family protein n=1 Tax=Microbacterium sp. CFH 31415 TaxID=2921732 RepID=UPI001F144D64|nr:DUF6541 family protein [Microbacterium sp. CFH 31415]MCH6231359.1 hypothetical protein [Microbacterium sp. CFH 31415]
MIAAWAGASPVLLVAFAVVFLPGLAIGAAGRLRGLTLWALAPVLGVAAFAGLALVYGAVRVPWSALTIVAGLAVLAGIAWLAGHWLGPRRTGPRPAGRGIRLLAAGLVIGIALTTVRFVIYVHDPAAISMTNDAVFHLNAVRHILETGSASSLQVSSVVGSRGFYPAAWHALASAVVLFTGVEIPVAANMVSLVIAAGVWPVGVTWLARRMAGAGSIVVPLTAALSASLVVFPMLMFQWGVLYSFALSLALVPAVAGLVVGSAAWMTADSPVAGRARSAVLLGVLLLAGLGAIALSQPASLLTWAIIAVSWFTWWAVPAAFATKGLTRGVLLVAAAAALAVFVALWIVLSRATSGSHWPPFRTKIEAVLDVLLNGPVLLPVMAGVSILMLVGVVVAALRRELRWLATAWVVLAGLYVVAASIGNPLLRRMLLGAWYADPYRIAAACAVVIVPLAAVGLAWIAGWATRAISRRRGAEADAFGARWALVAVASLGVAALIAAPMIQMRAVTQGTVDAESRYITPDYLSPDERALLERLDEHVGEGERVIGNPSTGMGFGYMLSGRDVFPRTWAHPRTPQWQLIQNDLRDAGTDPEVCEALETYGSPSFVVDFGLGESTPGRYELQGMTDFDDRPGFELVDREGDASLWRITACEP